MGTGNTIKLHRVDELQTVYIPSRPEKTDGRGRVKRQGKQIYEPQNPPPRSPPFFPPLQQTLRRERQPRAPGFARRALRSEEPPRWPCPRRRARGAGAQAAARPRPGRDAPPAPQSRAPRTPLLGLTGPNGTPGSSPTQLGGRPFQAKARRCPPRPGPLRSLHLSAESGFFVFLFPSPAARPWSCPACPYVARYLPEEKRGRGLRAGAASGNPRVCAWGSGVPAALSSVQTRLRRAPPRLLSPALQKPQHPTKAAATCMPRTLSRAPWFFSTRVWFL